MNNEKFKETIIRPLINILPLSLLTWGMLDNCIITYYHVVNDEDVSHITNLYNYKRVKQFIEDLEFLLNNYCPIGLKDLISYDKNKINTPPNSFLLTFDDGFREIYDVIAPILLDKGVTATFFLSSAFIDNRELCYQHKASLLIEKINNGISAASKEEIKNILVKIGLSFSEISKGILKVDYRRREVLDKIAEILQVGFEKYLNEKKPYLTSDQVKKLIKQGFTIGAHSIDHPYYSSLTLESQLEQTIGSVRKIRNMFSLEYGAFAFPHNDSGVSNEFFKKIQESGLIDMTFGTGGIDNWSIPRHRQRISLEKPLLPARKLIAWQYARKLYKQLRGAIY